jgi:hypothetical protein
MLRKSFVASTAAALLAGCTGGSKAPAAVSSAQIDDFMRLSGLLTGYSNLDPALGTIYLQNLAGSGAHASVLNGLLAAQSLDQLQRTGTFQDPNALPVVNDILSSWYTGTYTGSSGRVTATWTDALAWRACTFTKPPSTCAAPGSWSKPPA